MVNYTWDTILEPNFCEGRLIPYLIPNFYEGFSSISGLFLVMLGTFGLMQPKLEILMKLMYASLSMSGAGTIALHYNRIQVYNFADLYPLLTTMAFGIVALFEEVTFELYRAGVMNDSLIKAQRRGRDTLLHRKQQLLDYKRTVLDAIVYTGALAYLMIGLILVVFAEDLFTIDIVGFYFGIPFAFLAIIGMNYLTKFRPYADEKTNLSLRRLKWVTIITGLAGAAFKIIDTYACTPFTVWLFPHPMFHILVSYSAHCYIMFMAFYRANNELVEDEREPEIVWRLRFLPSIRIPDAHWDLATQYSIRGIAPGSPVKQPHQVTGMVPRINFEA